MESALNQLLSVPTDVYVAILTLVGGATFVSIITQVIKRWGKIANEKWATSLFILISAIFSVVEYIVTASDLPPTIIGISTVSIMGVAQPIYRFVVKPASMFISTVKAFQAAGAPKLEEINKASGGLLTPAIEAANAAIVKTDQPVVAVVPSDETPVTKVVQPEETAKPGPVYADF